MVSAAHSRTVQFRDFPALLDPKDLLVFNDTRVIPARAFGVKDSGGRVELLLERALTRKYRACPCSSQQGLEGRRHREARGRTKRAHAGPRGRVVRAAVSPAMCWHSSRRTGKFRCRLTSIAARRRRTGNATRPCMRARLVRVAAPTAGLHFDDGNFCGPAQPRHCARLRHAARGRRHLRADAHRRHRSTPDASGVPGGARGGLARRSMPRGPPAAA